MRYENMTQEEIIDIVKDLVLELKKAAYADNLHLLIMVDGRGIDPKAIIYDLELNEEIK